MKFTIIKKYFSRVYGCWMCIVFEAHFGMYYKIPLNLATSN